MTPLRQQMIEAMTLRGFSAHTHRAYLYAVTELAEFYGQCPSRLSDDQLKAYFRDLVLNRGFSPATCKVRFHGIRFLLRDVLDRRTDKLTPIFPSSPQRIPELLTRSEVARIIDHAENPKHRTLLNVCYACGLRVSEALALRVRDINGERKLLHIEQGKGAKDRMVMFGDALLRELRWYWSLYRPPHYHGVRA